MWTLCFSFAIIVAVYIPRSKSEIIDYVVGGSNAEAGEFPYQIYIERRESNKTIYCGGSIVNNCWILTAAQCVPVSDLSLYTVTAGTTKLNSLTAVKVKIKKIIRHEKYYVRDGFFNDIAVIRLQKCLTYNKYIRRVPLLSNYIDSDVIGILSGWGFNNQNGTSQPNNLKKLNVNTISNEDCIRTFGSGITDGKLCTLNVIGQGFCQGDSGGPLVDKNSKGQIGIVSANIPCARGFPDIYTRVSHYATWISNHTKI